MQTACIPDAHGHCATCSDEAQTATVLHVSDTGMALVALNEREIEIDVSLIEDVAEGQVLLVHGGVALERVEADA
ncbi:MAG: hydrogenase assembly protein HupF [Chloroflexi bacterium]|nr:hydrogenase assembly protein HupF [Chloroflexota bacterium]